MPRARAWQILMGLSLLLAVVVLGMGTSGSGGTAQELEPEREPELVRVRVAAVEGGAPSRSLRFAGVIRARRRARLSFTVGGRMVARPVDVGHRVEAGEVVAQLDLRELHNAVDSATAAVAESEARLAQLARDRERVERLVAQKAATEEELEQVSAGEEALEAVRAAARSRQREAQRLLSEGSLVAPFSGTVTAVLLEPGELATGGRGVVEVSGDGDFEVEVGVPETLVRHIREGQRVEVELPLSGGKAAGVVSSLSRGAAGAGYLFPVVVALEPSPAGAQEGPGEVVPGMGAEVVLEVASSASVTVPLAAVLNPGGHDPSVFRLRGDRVEQVPVEVAELVAGRVAVSGALDPGDEVVVTGHASLLDGQRVEVVR